MPEALLIYQKSAEFARDNLPAGHPILKNIESVLDSANKGVGGLKSKVSKKKTKAVFKTANLIAKRVSPRRSKREDEDEKSRLIDSSHIKTSETLQSTVEVEAERKPDALPHEEN